MKSLALALTLPLALSAAAPAAAPAKPVRNANLLVAGPLKVRNYKLYMIATPRHSHSAADVILILRRDLNRSLQSQYFNFYRGVSVKVGPASASVSGDFGRWGHLRLRFAGGSTGSLPAVCGGVTIGHDAGALLGRDGLHIDTHESYFGTFRASTMPAYITSVKGQATCLPSTPKHPTGVTQLSASAVQGTTTTSFTASRSATGFITQDVLVIEKTPSGRGPSILHAIDANTLPNVCFTFAADHSSAHVIGGGAFMSGALSFTGLGGSGSLVTGRLTGNLAAHIDGFRLVHPAAGAVAPVLEF